MSVHGLRADLLLSSLYSIRNPMTIQSAVTYPLPPPSSIKGMLANALQRQTDIAPQKAAETVEQNVLACFARANNPIVISSCTVRVLFYKSSARNFIRDARPREFAHATQIAIAALITDDELLDTLERYLKTAPIYLGDSESLTLVKHLKVKQNVELRKLNEGEIANFNTYARTDLLKEVRGTQGGVDTGLTIVRIPKNLIEHKELVPYVFPLKGSGRRYEPVDMITATLRTEAIQAQVDDLTTIIKK